MKYIIAIVVVVVGNAILLSINYYLGALLTAILSGGLIVWGFYYATKKKDAGKWIEDKVKFKKTKNTKVEEEVEEVEEEEEIEEELDKIEEELEEVEEEKGWGFFTYLFVFFVVAFLFYLFDFDFGKIAQIIMEVLKLLDALVVEFFRGIQSILNN